MTPFQTKKTSPSELRQLIAEKEGRILRGLWPSSSLACGVPKSAISEISGTAKIEWLAQFFRENPTLIVFWAEEKYNLLPTAFSQRGISLNRFIFADCGKELFVTLRKALRSHVFNCVVAPNQFEEERPLKALQLLTERCHSSLILLTEEIKPKWPVCLQVEIDHAPSAAADDAHFLIRIVKNKRSHSIEPTVIS